MYPNSTNKNKILYPELSYKIVGLLFDVHNSLGQYRSENQYADAIEERLKTLKISYKRESSLTPSFAGEKSRRNIVDFIIDDKIFLEIKAKSAILKEDYLQVKRYLVSANCELGLLVNFRRKYLYPKRILNKINL